MCKLIITTILLLSFFQIGNTQTTYFTVNDGLWTSNATWSPSIPPVDLSGDTLVISHDISHVAPQNITWTNNSLVHIEPNGSLDIVFIGTRKLQQLGGSHMLNEGHFSLDAGGDYVVEGASIHNTLSGTMDIRAKKVKFFDATYSDTTIAASTYIQNEGKISVPVDEIHNDGYIDNSGSIEAMDIHNDGYFCNSDSLVVFGEIDLHDNALGYLTCGGLLVACNLQMDGGAIWDQNVCCPGGNPTIDSTSSSYQTTDIDRNSTNFGSCLIVLSSELSSFDVRQTPKNTAQLTWRVSDSDKSARFIIERSQDAVFFDDVTEIHKQNQKSFSFEDMPPQSGIWYYRLRMVDANQAINYSKMKNVQLTDQQNSFSVFPIPCSDYISIKGDFENDTMITVLDAQGHRILTKTIAEPSSLVSIKHELPSGFYLLSIQQGSYSSNKKFVVR